MEGVILGGVQQLNADKTAVVIIPANLERVDQLFSIVESQLGLPVYFGKNWDAFSESLRDLSWVSRRTVALVHQGRTFEEDHLWMTYLDVLKECIADWRDDDEHQLIAVFPESCRDELGSLVRD